MTDKPFRVEAVLFDFDGTLTMPGALDFRRIKTAIGCPLDMPVLEFIENLPDAAGRLRAMSALDRFEEKGAKNSKPNPGTEALIAKLKGEGLKLGILSRNSRRAVDLAFRNFHHIRASDFDLILSRDDPVAPKPSPDGIFLAAEKLNVKVRHIMMVGDFIFDIQAGKNAGAMTVFLSNGTEHTEPASDFSISGFHELDALIRWGLPLQTGKLPQDLLGQFLKDVTVEDPSVRVRPGVGEDTAAVDLNGAEVLVLTSDPITFATDAIGRYAVVVNANDMATSGAVPRWLLTTLLFPYGVTPSEIARTMHDLDQTCRHCKITLCGGHTEITDAVIRPVVIGTMVGTVTKENLVDKHDMRPGDRVLLTKGVSVEGTAIVAREFGERLKTLGMSGNEVARCRDFLSDLSVLPEAEIAAACEGVSAMHDITEGGIATAVEELSVSGGYGIRVKIDAIHVFSETKKICRLMGMDPLGLIGSGSLLICCKESAWEELAAKIRQAGVNVACIGEVTGKGSGVEATKEGEPFVWPRFEVDEITRFF